MKKRLYVYYTCVYFLTSSSSVIINVNIMLKYDCYANSCPQKLKQLGSFTGNDDTPAVLVVDRH